jgi:hypothetical protein
VQEKEEEEEEVIDFSLIFSVFCQILPWILAGFQIFLL